jgi:hypothetical protein
MRNEFSGNEFYVLLKKIISNVKTKKEVERLEKEINILERNMDLTHPFTRYLRKTLEQRKIKIL